MLHLGIQTTSNLSISIGELWAATSTKGSLQKNLQTDVEGDVAYIYNWRGLAYMYKEKLDHRQRREMVGNPEIQPDLWPPRRRRPPGRRHCRRSPLWSIRYPVRWKLSVLGFGVMGTWSEILRCVGFRSGWISQTHADRAWVCGRIRPDLKSGRDPRTARSEVRLDFSNRRRPSVGFWPDTVKDPAGRPVRGGRERVPEKEGVREKGEKQVFFSFF
jgi:hypothetical protein